MPTRLNVAILGANGNIGGAGGSPVDPSLAPAGSVIGGVAGPPAWQTATSYAVNQLVTNSGSVYICTTLHTSGGSFDLTKWQNLGVSLGVGAANQLGVQGATSAVTMLTRTVTPVTVTLTADHVCTITPALGGSIRFYITQDATGGHTFAISDGTTTELLPVATAASAFSLVTIDSPDGTTLWEV